MTKFIKPEKSLDINPIVHPRKEWLPPIHDRNNNIYMGINWQNPITGVENGWIRDIFEQYNEICYSFKSYRNCSNHISNFGVTNDKTAFYQDYLPRIKEGIKKNMIQPGYTSPGDLNQFMQNETQAKLKLVLAAFAEGSREINILDEPVYIETYGKYLLDNYVPSKNVSDNREKIHDVFKTAEKKLFEFKQQFENDLMNYDDYNAICKYNRDQALVYMLLCRPDVFKIYLRSYETYCRILAICDVRYEELIRSRFEREKNKKMKYKVYQNLNSDKEWVDALMLIHEKAIAKGSSSPYNPRYYMELLNGRKLPIPRIFNFLASAFDMQLVAKYIKLWDSDNEQYIKYLVNTDPDTWKIINGLDRILNEDNVHYVNGKIVPRDRETLAFNRIFIESLDKNDKPKRKSKKSTIKPGDNVIHCTYANYNFYK